MPIYSPTGFLDITNATLRTSNLEAQNFKLNGGNIYVTSELTTDELLNLDNVVNAGNTTPHTVEFQNATTGFVTTANVEVGTANLFVDTSTSNVGIGTNAPIDTLHINGGTRFAGHIIPTTNATFDIGSAENKVRDLYVDTNSIWVGDRAKIAFENGKMKFKRRKLNKVPRMLVNLAINHGRTDEADVETHAIAFAQTIDSTISTVSDLKLEHIRDYAKTFDNTKSVSDIFADNEEDYEAITASEAFMEVGSNIFTEHSLSIGKTTDPTATLDIYKEDTTAAGASTLSSITGVFSGSDATGGTINNRGLYINLDSSATGGTSSSNPAEEHRVWGIDVDIDVTGDSDDIRGGRFLVRSELAENGTDRTSVIYGIDAQGQHNGSAPNTNITGVNARSFKGSNSTGSTTKMVGVNAEYEINAGTCTDAYGVRSLFDRNGGAVTNSYLFYGGHVGDTTTITNNYGLYVTGTDKHYLEGDVGIGVTDPVYNLDVNNEIQIRGQGLIYHANETSDSESSRYFLKFNKTLDVSYPVLCNRTPNGNVVIATGTSSGGGEVERMRFNGGDGTITMDVGRGDVYFENNSNDNASGNGITLRTPTNPGSTGSIFAVRSSGNGCRLWVGQDVTAVASDSDFCAGQNGYAVGSEDDRSTYNFIVKAGGNVGIGTTTPGARLHVYNGTGTVASEMILGPSAAADTAGIVKYFHGDGSGTGYMIMGNWGDSMSAGTGLVVKKGGDVGIGTTSPVGVNGGQRIEGSSSTGFEYIATRADTGVATGNFIGAYLFKNADAGGTPPHYAGMSAKATGTGGNMILYFHTARENYETDTSNMILDSSGRLEVGGGRLLVGTGGKLGLTINDGDGNANITFNHGDTVPDQNGSAGRIDCGVDGNAGYMRLRVKNSVTAGTSVSMPNCLRIEEGYVRAYADLYVDDRVGIGTTVPDAVLDVRSGTEIPRLRGDAGRSLFMGSNYTHVNSTGFSETSTNYAWDGYPGVVRMNSGGEWRVHGEGSNNVLIRTDGGFAPFTGLHETYLPFDEDDQGKIVYSTGNYASELKDGNVDGVICNYLTVLDACPVVKICATENDKRVMGVLSTRHLRTQIKEITKEEYELTMGDEKYAYEKKEGADVYIRDIDTDEFSRGYYNAVGEGGIWVCNKNGNLENGDYITSSTVAGYGQKQNDDLLHNYTVAKITTDCDFTEIWVTTKKHKKTREGYLFDENNEPVYENILDTEGNTQNHLKFKLRYLLPDGTQISEEEYTTKTLADEKVYVAAFVGCTYHCG
jgi:hypothetical protein